MLCTEFDVRDVVDVYRSVFRRLITQTVVQGSVLKRSMVPMEVDNFNSGGERLKCLPTSISSGNVIVEIKDDIREAGTE